MGGAAGHGAAVAAAIAGHRREEAAAEAAEEAAGKGAAGVPDASAPPAEVTSASGGSRDVPPAGWFPAAPAPPPLLQRLCCVCCPTTGQPHAGGLLMARVWCGAHRPHFAWPERRAGAPAAAARAFAARGVNGGLQGPKGAVCLAGGGVRACTVALGYARALHAAGRLSSGGYLITNSGASWLSLPLCFQRRVTPEDFLGPVLPPETLALAAARGDGRRGFAATIARARILRSYTCGVTKDSLSLDCCFERDETHVRAWSRAVGEAFLAPHGLGSASAAYCVRGDEARVKDVTRCAEVHAWPGALGKAGGVVKAAPFPVFLASVQPKGHPLHSFPLEFTPYYSALPARFEARTHFGRNKLTLGGVCVEPFGVNAEPTPDGAEVLKVTERKVVERKEVAESDGDDDAAAVCLRSHWTVPLEQVAGVSSGFIAQTMVDSQREGMWELLGNDELNLFSPDGGQSAEFPVGDGAGTDNLGLLSAVRRGCERILVCYNFSRPFVADSGARLYQGPAGTQLFAKHYSYFARLWGRAGKVPKWGKVTPWARGSEATKMTLESFNAHTQVFKTEDFDPFVAEIEAAASAREPVIVRRSLEVLPNASVGVTGGFVTEMLFVAVTDSAEFREALPKETDAWLTEHYADAKKQGAFPYLKTMQLKYEPELVSLLSQLASWTVAKASGAIEELFGDDAAGDQL